jgi:hypothetical protein
VRLKELLQADELDKEVIGAELRAAQRRVSYDQFTSWLEGELSITLDQAVSYMGAASRSEGERQNSASADPAPDSTEKEESLTTTTNGGAMPVTLQQAIAAAEPDLQEALTDGVRMSRIKALTPAGFEAFADACMENQGTSPEVFAQGVLAIAKAAGGMDAVTSEDVAKAADEHRWRTNAGLRAEFGGNKERFLSYQAGVRAGRIRNSRA